MDLPAYNEKHGCAEFMNAEKNGLLIGDRVFDRLTYRFMAPYSK